MSKKQIEIIKKIEAEARKIKPKVLNSKRSAFLNKNVKERSSPLSSSMMVPCSEISYIVTADNNTPFVTLRFHSDILSPTNPPIEIGVPPNTFLSPGMPMVNNVSNPELAVWGYFQSPYTTTNVGPAGPTGGGGATPNGIEFIAKMWSYQSGELHEYFILPPSPNNGPYINTYSYSYSRSITINAPGMSSSSSCFKMKDHKTIIFCSENAPYDIFEFDISTSVGVLNNTLVNSTYGGGIDFGWGSPYCMMYYANLNMILLAGNKYDNNNDLVASYYLIDGVTGNICDFWHSLPIFGNPSGQIDQALSMYFADGKTWVFTQGKVREISFCPLTLNSYQGGSNQWLHLETGASQSCFATLPGCVQSCGGDPECYYIGDTGPEGGTIFAVPLGHPQNNGVNQTNFYYEVAKNDISIGGTPNTGFNLTCGDAFTTTQSIPNMAVNGFALIAPGTYSFNIGDEITSLTPGLFPPGTTIVSVNPLPISGLTSFIASNSANFTGPPHTIILTSTQLVSGWSASGAEWGVHNKPNIVTSTDFGTGHKNTDEIDAYPSSPGNPTGGIHPWLDTHDIAATLCKQTEGYFLPSYQEFREMVNASNDPTYGFPLNLNTSTQFSENYYWTSSHRLPPSTVLPNPHKYAWAYNTDTDNLELAYRCHALSVRPIRRFECEPEPPFVDKGIDYDYRIDTSGNNSVGTIDSMYNPYSAAGDISVMYHTGESYMFSPLSSSYSAGSVNIGANSIAIMFNRSLTHSVDPAALPSLIQPNGLLPDIGDPIFNILTPDPITGGPPYQLSLGPISQVILDTDPQWASTFQNINTPASAGGLFGAGAVGVYQWSDPANNTYNYPNHEPFDHSIIIDTILVFDVPLPGGKGAQQSPQNQTGYDPTTNPITLWTYDTGSGSHMNFWHYPPGTRFGEGSPNLNHGLRFQTSVPNNLYSPNVFSGYEIGHDYLKFVDWNRFDVRYNDLHGLSNYPDRLDGYANEIFSIKIYNQYEELLGDWDYKLKDRHGGKGCCVNHCHHIVVWEKVQTNYVNPLHSSHPDVVDLSVYHEGLAQAGHPEGWAYVSITCKTDLTWNSGMTRGNTLNLEDWRGTGQNNRTKDNTYPISGIQWKWQKEVCGDHSSTNTCCSVLCGRYKAELNPPSLNIYCHTFNTATPNHTVLFNTKQDCTSGGVSVINSTQAKLINPSENYSDEINQCFEDGETEVDVYIFSQAKHDENISKRQKFINDKKPKETGPFGIAGYYPLYDTIEAATYNSPTPIESRTGENTYGYHIHDFGGQEYYMPNGLGGPGSGLQFHGDYDGQIIPETIAQPETIQPEEQVIQPEQPSVVTITPKLPEPLVPPPSTPTYTPPPSTSSGESEGGGY